jgi:prepilin-type N-terminal cleavage/methylation domain-containing protein
MKIMKKKRGFSLTEVLIAATIMGFIFAAVAGLYSTTIKSFAFTNNQYDADMGASLALQNLNRELQEAKQVTIVSPTRIRIKYLQKDINGVYIRNAVDEVNYVDVFRGNANLTANASGSCLIHSPATGQARVIARNVTALEFRSFTSSSVDVTLRTEYGKTGSKRNCQMVHRAIFLRNY